MRRAIDDFDDEFIELSVGAVQNLLVDGVAPDVEAATMSQQAVIEWDPPTLGDPDLYAIRIERIDRDSASDVAWFGVYDTEFEVPMDFLSPGREYFLTVTAVVGLEDPHIPMRQQANTAWSSRTTRSLLVVDE